MRGKEDTAGWQHHDIPIGNCHRCNHRVYRDEPHERHSFVDASGNNDYEYFHKECPKHTLKVRNIIIEHRCSDCGVTINEEYKKS